MAAAVSPPASAYTPASSPHDHNRIGDWDYSVSTDGSNAPPPSFRERSNNSIPHRSHIPPKPDGDAAKPGSSDPYSQINGYHHQPIRNDSYANPLDDDHNQDAELLVAPKPFILRRHDSTVSSTGGDSLFDLYGGRMSTASADSYAQMGEPHVPVSYAHTNGVDSAYGHGQGEDPEDSKWIHRDKLNENEDGDVDERELERTESKWIHRDKLARIEGREVEDYLYDTEHSRWIHKDKLEQIEGQEAEDYLFDRENSRWIHKDKLEQIESQELQQAGIRVSQRSEAQGRSSRGPRVSSPSGDEGMYEGSMVYGHDPRLPAERNSDPNRPGKQFRRNPSYSRIPLSTTSPIPVPQEFLERNTPLPRPQVSPTGSDDGHPNTAIPVRKRAHSAGSAMLLDDREKSPALVTGPTPGPISNPKNSSRNPAPGGRKSTNSRNTSLSGKQRTRSNPQLYRPNTSASHGASFGTQGSGTKAPEGPPPWSTSYQPDPSLPPDQQIIPTLARKMQQEQWERDGKSATIYDRQLRPLKVHESEEFEKERKETSDGAEEWPLKTPSSVPSEASKVIEKRDSKRESGRESLGGGERRESQAGGYSAMPKISGQPLSNLPERPLPQVQQLPDSDEDDKDKKKKSFCCCVVM